MDIWQVRDVGKVIVDIDDIVVGDGSGLLMSTWGKKRGWNSFDVG